MTHVANDGHRAGQVTTLENAQLHGRQVLRFVDHDVAVGDELRLVELLGLRDRETLSLTKSRGAVISGVGVEVDAREHVLSRLWSGTGTATRADKDASFVNQRGVGLGPSDLFG